MRGKVTLFEIFEKQIEFSPISRNSKKNLTYLRITE